MAAFGLCSFPREPRAQDRSVGHGEEGRNTWWLAVSFLLPFLKSLMPQTLPPLPIAPTFSSLKASLEKLALEEEVLIREGPLGGQNFLIGRSAPP